MFSVFHATIRRKLILLVFIAILPALGIIVYSGLERRSLQIEQAGLEVRRIAESAAEIQNRTALSVRQLLIALAHTQEVLSQDLEACSRLFQDMLSLNPSIYNIAITDASGDVLAAALPFEQANLSDRKHFKEARAFFDFAAGEFIETRIAPIPAFPYAYPVLDENGYFRGVLTAVISLSGYQDFFQSVSLPSGSFIGITDHQGVRLFREPADEDVFPLGQPINLQVWMTLSGQMVQQTFVEQISDRSLQIIAYQNLQLRQDLPPYMYMVVGMPRSEVLALTSSKLFRDLTLLLGASVMAFVLAWLVGDLTIVKKFMRLQEASDELARGNLGVRTGLAYGDGEMGRLARSFDSMAEQLTRDMDKREKAQAELRVSEENYRTLVNGLPDIIMLFDRHGRHLFVSENIGAVLDIEVAGLLGKKHSELGFSAEEIHFWEDSISQVFNAGTSLETEFTFVSRQGPSIHNCRFLPVQARQGNIDSVLCICRDVTRRKHLEQERERLHAQLLQAQKMESVGILAAGVAHDFNNLLHAMSVNVELLMGGKDKGHPDLVRLKAVADSMDRASMLVKQLLVFGRRAESNKTRVDLNLEVKKTVRILERTIPKMVSMELDLDQAVQPLMADPVQMEQILLNLVSNAADAMPNGGTVRIETKNTVLDQGVASLYPDAASGPYVLLTVSDTGSGMSQEVLEHVFDPFFTTKEVGKGTGLGLASAYGIVRNHGGFIQIDSEPDRGTRVKVYLPAGGQPEILEVDLHKQDIVQGGNETILMVDDEPEILELTGEALESLGYTVISAVNGEQALKIYREHGQAIDLVLLDLNMPGMGGHNCLLELIRHDPGVRVVIASGYSARGHGSQALASGAKGFIAKPYRLTELAVMLRDVLDSKEQQTF
ncbi:ATP-binding protein [Desulfonatronovibrio hydrogenovorans]|uniref:ATP-binding protein n=1 Tax=Desulfonatronovibrio hydrogenovorans TaxID=53245 RepID=UPI00068A0B30|nr:ATP-binding protein [Desulfonatronovibrio hydrogenovorans]